MAGKVEEIIASMPTLKVELGDIFNFEGKCIDPLASEIISESLGYALETSIRRLESVSKINPRIYENATESVLPAVKTLMEVIKRAPGCDVSTLATAEPKPPPRKPKLDIKKADKAEKKPKPKKTAKTAGELVGNLTAAKEKAETQAKEPEVETVKQEEARVLATLEPEKRKDLERLKKINIEAYDAAIEGLAKGSKVFKAPPQKTKIEIGKQFTIAYDGQEQIYHMVGDIVAGRADMQPSEKGVSKLSEASSLAKIVEGKKAGDDVFIEIEGKKYKAQIKDVKDGSIKQIQPEVKLPTPEQEAKEREQRFKAAMLPYEKVDTSPQTFEQAKAPHLVGGSLQRKIGDKWIDFTPIKDEDDAMIAQLILKKGYKESGKTSPASEFRIIKGKEILEGGK